MLWRLLWLACCGLLLASSAPIPNPPRAGRRKSVTWRLLWLACCGLLLASLGAGCVFAAASWANYPGGDALMALHAMEYVTLGLKV